jgi:hypothetical protein
MGQDPQAPVASWMGPFPGSFGEVDIPGGTIGYDTKKEA